MFNPSVLLVLWALGRLLVLSYFGLETYFVENADYTCPPPAPFGTFGRSQGHEHWLGSRMAFLHSGSLKLLVMILWFCVTAQMQKLIRECDDCVAPVVYAEEKKRPALTMTAQKFSRFVSVVKSSQVPKAQVYRTWADKAASATTMNLNKSSANPPSVLWQQSIADVPIISQSVFSHLPRICRPRTFWATGFSAADLLAILDRWTTSTFDFIFSVSR